MAKSSKKLSKRETEVEPSEGMALARAQDNAPNPVWFKPVMFGFMLLGLIWIVVYYITSANMGLPIPALGQANLFVGFGLVLVGFLMTPWWK